MAIIIVRLSDLRFGGGFDIAQWRAVEKAIISLNPNLIIVSGDLVDHLLPEHLKKAEASAQLFVVPGNRDLFYFGNDMRWGRVGWHIFNAANGADAGGMRPPGPASHGTLAAHGISSTLTQGHVESVSLWEVGTRRADCPTLAKLILP